MDGKVGLGTVGPVIGDHEGRRQLRIDLLGRLQVIAEISGRQISRGHEWWRLGRLVDNPAGQFRRVVLFDHDLVGIPVDDVALAFS